jgi:hypothetical protein
MRAMTESMRRPAAIRQRNFSNNARGAALSLAAWRNVRPFGELAEYRRRGAICFSSF